MEKTAKSRHRLSRTSRSSDHQQEIKLFAIVWLKVLPSAAEAIWAAKLRAHDVARRHPGREPDTFRLMDATGKILGVVPKKSVAVVQPNGIVLRKAGGDTADSI
jgi:hypothetical protein